MHALGNNNPPPNMTPIPIGAQMLPNGQPTPNITTPQMAAQVKALLQSHSICLSSDSFSRCNNNIIHEIKLPLLSQQQISSNS
jgi:hypothetical protein